MRLTTEVEILDHVREIVAATPERLEMGSCLAELAKELSGDEGSPAEVGRRLLPITARTIGFCCDKRTALAWLESRGYAANSLDGFLDAMVARGPELIVCTRETVRDSVSDTVQTVGGVFRAFGSVTLQTVGGGVVRLRSKDALVIDAATCTVITEEWSDNRTEWVETGRTVYP